MACLLCTAGVMRSIELDPEELAPALSLVKQGIIAQLRNPLHHYHTR